MKKTISLFILFIFAFFSFFSCAEKRVFTHIYCCIITEVDNGRVIPRLDGNGQFSWGAISVNFSGGDELDYYWDENTKIKISKSDNVRPFYFNSDSTISENVSDAMKTKANYSISGKKDDLFSFDSWKVVVPKKDKNGDVTYTLEPYNGTGCEDMIFYATYATPKPVEPSPIPDPISGPPYRHIYLTIPTTSTTTRGGSVKLETGTNEFIWDEFFRVEDFKYGQKIGYYYDEDGEHLISQYAGNPDISNIGVKGFILTGDYLSDATVVSKGEKNKYSFTGQVGSQYVFDKWVVYNNGKFSPYSGDGQQDLVFYPTYKKFEQ